MGLEAEQAVWCLMPAHMSLGLRCHEHAVEVVVVAPEQRLVAGKVVVRALPVAVPAPVLAAVAGVLVAKVQSGPRLWAELKVRVPMADCWGHGQSAADAAIWGLKACCGPACSPSTNEPNVSCPENHRAWYNVQHSYSTRFLRTL